MSDNPVRVPFHLGDPGIMTSDKQFSIHVSRTLDCLGKNQDMVKYRVKMYGEWHRYLDILTPNLFKPIVVGSKGEGLTSPYESDNDYMLVTPGVICAHNVRPYTHNRNTTIFQTERHDTPAGYTKLKLIQESPHISIYEMHEALFQNANGERYISSDFYITNIQQVVTYLTSNQCARSGPSLPDDTDIPIIDRVHGFCCICPDLLQAFITRPRPYNRPSRSMLNDIGNMDVHVVPVGRKNSDTSYQEWRICFTKAEIYLIYHFNDTETKLYILLKMVSKLLKNEYYDITSYIMKNVVLWLVELYPADLFIEELLTAQLIQALIFLKKCVEVNFLPSYMIPDRNLLAERLKPVQRCGLTSILSTLIHEEGCLLLRCEKLKVGMTILYREPNKTEEFRWRKDMLEKIWLFDMNMQFDKCKTTCVSPEEVIQFLFNICDEDNITSDFHIVLPDCRVLLLQGYSTEAVKCCYLERTDLMLS